MRQQPENVFGTFGYGAKFCPVIIRTIFLGGVL